MTVLTFHGAAQEVTGSCHMLESDAFGRILLECGMHQGGDAVDRIQSESFPFEPASIDAVVLSHAHLDHSGLLPKLVSKGFEGPIFCTPATKRLLEVMLEDAAGIYEKDLAYENLRRKRRGDHLLKPAYRKKDVKKALALCKVHPYKQQVEVSKGLSLCFHDAGHILGSAIVELKIKEQHLEKTLVFSGDLGNKDSALMKDPAVLTQADVVLMEGTYGNRNHRSQTDTIRQFKEILKETWERGGNVMIPSFAVGRTQEVLFHLGELHRQGELDDWSIFLDSPMAIEVTGIYDDCIHLLDPEDVDRLKGAYESSLRNFLPRLQYTRTPEQSMAINRIKKGAIIIAGSGMCTGGRIRHHFKQRIWNKKNSVIFVGFQARGTLGRLLVDGAKQIRLFRDEYAVKARIETLGGFSAHADQEELMTWLSHFGGDSRMFLVHGEAATLDALSMKLWQDKGLSTEIPYQGQQVFF